jgi:hypothetical protein
MKLKKALLPIFLTSFLVSNDAFSLVTNTRYANQRNAQKHIGYMKSNGNGGFMAVGGQQYNNYYLAQYSQEDCISVLLQALDKACYDDIDVSNGVYQDCADSSMSDLSTFMDANLFYVVPANQEEHYRQKCSAYKSKAIERFLSIKNNIEQSAKESSYECQRAKDLLNKAKDCHMKVISSSGSYFDGAKGSCSGEVRRDFERAGNMGASNIMGYVDNFTTGQFTGKEANWRQTVDAVLSTYMMKAKAACGVDDFEITDINLYSPDSQTNSLTKQRDACAMQKGINNANAGLSNSDANIINAIGSSINKIKGRTSAQPSAPAVAPADSDGSKLDALINGVIYNINTTNIGVATSRLSIILENPTYVDANNPIDAQISQNVFGSAVSKNNIDSFVSHVNNMSGKTNIFVISSNNTGMNICSVQKQVGDRLVPIDSRTALQSSKLKVYLSQCTDITGF